MPVAPPQLDAERISRRLDLLAGHSDDGSCLTRLTLTPAHRAAADLVAGWMRQAGMSVRIDAAGNLRGRREAATRQAPVLVLGSHLDTVRDAGRYDGALGVVLAVAVAEAIGESGRDLPFDLEIVAFSDEEGVRFPSTLTGSRTLAGTVDPAMLEEQDREGIARREALVAFGAEPPSLLGAAALDPAHTLGFIEAHIEQGPVLEVADLPVAVVSAISGATRGTIRIQGMAGHAGTLPMTMRRDALTAAAEIVLAIETIGRGGEDIVATVGRLEVVNGADNTVPGIVSLSLDLRSPSDTQRAGALRAINSAVADIAVARNVEAVLEINHDEAAAACDPALADALALAIDRAGLKVLRLPSGAGHDAMSFRDRIPMAMLFVRCRGGVSHSPLEHAAPDDIGVAAWLLFDFVTSFQVP